MCGSMAATFQKNKNFDMEVIKTPIDGLDWRIPTDKAILSEKDTKHPLLKDFDSPFVY